MSKFCREKIILVYIPFRSWNWLNYNWNNILQPCCFCKSYRLFPINALLILSNLRLCYKINLMATDTSTLNLSLTLVFTAIDLIDYKTGFISRTFTLTSERGESCFIWKIRNVEYLTNGNGNLFSFQMCHQMLVFSEEYAKGSNQVLLAAKK